MAIYIFLFMYIPVIEAYTFQYCELMTSCGKMDVIVL